MLIPAKVAPRSEAPEVGREAMQKADHARDADCYYSIDILQINTLLVATPFRSRLPRCSRIPFSLLRPTGTL